MTGKEATRSKPPKKGRAKACKKAAPESAPTRRDDVRERLRAARAGMKLIGQVLRSAAKTYGDHGVAADHVSCGAYLYLMQSVVAALQGLSDALKIEDLVKLSRILAEQRRAGGTARGVKRQQVRESNNEGDKSPGDVAPGGCLPPGFGRVVRAVYGASFAPDVIGKETCATAEEDRQECEAGL